MTTTRAMQNPLKVWRGQSFSETVSTIMAYAVKITKTIPIAIIMLLSVAVHAQNVRWDSAATTVALPPPPNAFPPLLAIPGATITASATTYTGPNGTACPSATPVVLNGTSTCVAYADQQGNFGFWVAPGVTFAYNEIVNGTTYGPYSATSPGSGTITPASYGAVCNWNPATQTGADDTAAFQAAIAAAQALIGPYGAPSIYIPSGKNCMVSGELTSSGIDWLGAGSTTSTITTTNPTGNLLTITNANQGTNSVVTGGVNIRGLSLMGNGAATGGAIVELDGINNAFFDDVVIGTHGGRAIQLNNSERFTTYNVLIQGVRWPMILTGAQNESNINNTRFVFDGQTTANGGGGAVTCYDPVNCPTGTYPASGNLYPTRNAELFAENATTLNMKGMSLKPLQYLNGAQFFGGSVDASDAYFEQGHQGWGVAIGGQSPAILITAATGTGAGGFGVQATGQNGLTWWPVWYSKNANLAAYSTTRTAVIHPVDYNPNSTSASVAGGGILQNSYEEVSLTGCAQDTATCTVTARGVNSTTPTNWPATYSIMELVPGAEVATLNPNHIHTAGSPSPGSYTYATDNTGCYSSADIIVGYQSCLGYSASVAGSYNSFIQPFVNAGSVTANLYGLDMVNSLAANSNSPLGSILVHNFAVLNVIGGHALPATQSTVVPNVVRFDNFGGSYISAASYPPTTNYPAGRQAQYCIFDPAIGRTACNGSTPTFISNATTGSGPATAPVIQATPGIGFEDVGLTFPVPTIALAAGGSLPVGVPVSVRAAWVNTGLGVSGQAPSSNVQILNGGSGYTATSISVASCPGATGFASTANPTGTVTGIYFATGGTCSGTPPYTVTVNPFPGTGGSGANITATPVTQTITALSGAQVVVPTAGNQEITVTAPGADQFSLATGWQYWAGPQGRELEYSGSPIAVGTGATIASLPTGGAVPYPECQSGCPSIYALSWRATANTAAGTGNPVLKATQFNPTTAATKTLFAIGGNNPDGCATWASGALGSTGTACASSGGVTLQTNGTNNASQTTLDLINGTNITFANTTAGNVQASFSGILPVANGGTGTATPGLVQGSNITISGSWPNQTINAIGGGTITGVTAGTALTGGGTSGTVTLNVDTTQVPLLASNNIFTGGNKATQAFSLANFTSASQYLATYGLVFDHTPTIMVDDYFSTSDLHGGTDGCYAFNQAVAASFTLYSRFKPVVIAFANTPATGNYTAYVPCVWSGARQVEGNGATLTFACGYGNPTPSATPNGPWCATPTTIPNISMTLGSSTSATVLTMPTGGAATVAALLDGGNGNGGGIGARVGCVFCKTGSYVSAINTGANTVTLSLPPDTATVTGTMASTSSLQVWGTSNLNGIVANSSLAVNGKCAGSGNVIASVNQQGGVISTATGATLQGGVQGFTLTSDPTCVDYLEPMTLSGNATVKATFEQVQPVMVYAACSQSLDPVNGEAACIWGGIHGLHITDTNTQCNGANKYDGMGLGRCPGVQGLQIYGADGFKAQVDVQQFAGAGVVLGGDCYNHGGGETDSSGLKNCKDRETSVVALTGDWKDDGDGLTGQATIELMTGHDFGSAGSDENNGDVVSANCDFNYGACFLQGTYDSGNWSTPSTLGTSVDMARQNKLFIGHVEGGNHLGLYDDNLIQQYTFPIEIQYGRSMHSYGNIATGAPFGKATVGLFQVSDWDLSGSTLEPTAKNVSICVSINGTNTITASAYTNCSGTSAITGFPNWFGDPNYLDGQPATLNDGTSTYYIWIANTNETTGAAAVSDSGSVSCQIASGTATSYTGCTGAFGSLSNGNWLQSSTGSNVVIAPQTLISSVPSGAAFTVSLPPASNTCSSFPCTVTFVAKGVSLAVNNIVSGVTSSTAVLKLGWGGANLQVYETGGSFSPIDINYNNDDWIGSTATNEGLLGGLTASQVSYNVYNAAFNGQGVNNATNYEGYPLSVNGTITGGGASTATSSVGGYFQIGTAGAYTATFKGPSATNNATISIPPLTATMLASSSGTSGDCGKYGSTLGNWVDAGGACALLNAAQTFTLAQTFSTSAIFTNGFTTNGLVTFNTNTIYADGGFNGTIHGPTSSASSLTFPSGLTGTFMATSSSVTSGGCLSSGATLGNVVINTSGCALLGATTNTFTGSLVTAGVQISGKCYAAYGATVACGSSTAGVIAVPAATATGAFTIDTTAVSASNSIVMISHTSQAPSGSGLTCGTPANAANVAEISASFVTGTSFNLNLLVSPTTNPECIVWELR